MEKRNFFFSAHNTKSALRDNFGITEDAYVAEKLTFPKKGSLVKIPKRNRIWAADEHLLRVRKPPKFIVWGDPRYYDRRIDYS